MSKCPSCRQPLKQAEVPNILVCISCGKKFKVQPTTKAKQNFEKPDKRDPKRVGGDPQDQRKGAPKKQSAPPPTFSDERFSRPETGAAPGPPLPSFADNFPLPDKETQPGSKVTSSSVSRILAQGKQPTGFIEFVFAIFDFTFQYYLTPYIIRLYWMGIILIAGCSITGSTIGLISSFLPERNELNSHEVQQKSEFPMFNYAEDDWQAKLVRFIGSTTFKVVIFVAQIIVTVFTLLGIRIICEVMVVVFNIANALVSIKNKLEFVGREGTPR